MALGLPRGELSTLKRAKRHVVGSLSGFAGTDAAELAVLLRERLGLLRCRFCLNWGPCWHESESCRKSESDPNHSIRRAGRHSSLIAMIHFGITSDARGLKNEPQSDLQRCTWAESTAETCSAGFEL